MSTLWKTGDGRYCAVEHRQTNPRNTQEVEIVGPIYDVTVDVQKLLAEARADERQKCCADVCSFCAHKSFLPAERTEAEGWSHAHELTREGDPTYWCAASAIHERAFQQAQAGQPSQPVDNKAEINS